MLDFIVSVVPKKGAVLVIPEGVIVSVGLVKGDILGNSFCTVLCDTQGDALGAKYIEVLGAVEGVLFLSSSFSFIALPMLSFSLSLMYCHLC